MKYRIISLCFIGLAASAIIACIVYISTPKVIETSASLLLYAKDISELEDNSELIVKAKVKEVVENHVEYDELKIPDYGYTLTNIDVINVYKGEDKIKDSTLLIREPTYHYKDSLNRKYIVNIEGYIPLKQGETYMLFLGKSYIEGAYHSIGAYQGKYIIKDKDVENKILERIDTVSADEIDASETVMTGIYKKLYKEVMEKYNK